MNKFSYCLLVLLVGVIFLIPSFAIANMTTFHNYIVPFDTTSDVTNDIYYRQQKYDPLEMETYSGEKEYINTYEDLYSSTNDGQTYITFPVDESGYHNLLVLPVSFSDSNKDNLHTRWINIHNAFFGERGETTSYSVSEYYNISSYGKVKIKGEVAPYYEIDMSSEEIKNLSHTKSYISRYITTCALEYFVSTGNDLNRFDNNNDNFIDGLFVVYDFPYSDDNNDLYWAYVDHSPVNMRAYIGGKSSAINNIAPYFTSYGWASYDFMHKSLYSKVDAHVYTHEVGHLFGLLDYYSTSSTYQPLGYLDMMDFNIGDHNAFSKYLLSWATPFVLKDEGVVELSPFSTSGNFILIPSSTYSNNPFGEYLILEFYSPTGVNSYDRGLSFAYKTSEGEIKEGSMYTNYGVKLYHVDARVGYFERKNTDSLIGCVNDINIADKLNDAREDKTITSWCYRFINDNDNRITPLIKIIEKGETNYLKSSIAASNDTLFKKGDIFKFDNNSFTSYTFNNKEAIPFGFKIEDISPDKATIRFVKK